LRRKGNRSARRARRYQNPRASCTGSGPPA
jgi:hypothetical protein